jgi:hypothetical protein
MSREMNHKPENHREVKEIREKNHGKIRKTMARGSRPKAA